MAALAFGKYTIENPLEVICVYATMSITNLTITQTTVCIITYYMKDFKNIIQI